MFDAPIWFQRALAITFLLLLAIYLYFLFFAGIADTNIARIPAWFWALNIALVAAFLMMLALRHPSSKPADGPFRVDWLRVVAALGPLTLVIGNYPEHGGASLLWATVALIALINLADDLILRLRNRNSSNKTV